LCLSALIYIHTLFLHVALPIWRAVRDSADEGRAHVLVPDTGSAPLRRPVPVRSVRIGARRGDAAVPAARAAPRPLPDGRTHRRPDRKSTRLNSKYLVCRLLLEK